MTRGQACVCLVVLSGLLVSCGGGSSPTAPDPVPRGSLDGTWQGEMSGSVGGAAFTCALQVSLSDEGDGIFGGGWRADCPGATVAGPVVAVTFAGVSILNGLPSPAGTAAPPSAPAAGGRR